MKILVTGAAGFIGFSMCEYYLKKNITLLVLIILMTIIL